MVIHKDNNGKDWKSDLYIKLYTLSTENYLLKTGEKTEHPFCEVLIKIEKEDKMSKIGLTYIMSKTSK